MNRELISQLHAEFEQLVHTESEAGVEFWLARDLQTRPWIHQMGEFRESH